MIDWDLTPQEPAVEDDADFRECVTTEGEFTASYRDERGERDGPGCDMYSHGGFVYISSPDDQDDEHAVVVSCSQMNRLARDWLRFRGRFPWMQDE